MCEQAAEAHKSKGVGHASRRRMTSEPGQISKSSVDALLSNNSPATSSKVLVVLSMHFMLSSFFSARVSLLSCHSSYLVCGMHYEHFEPLYGQRLDISNSPLIMYTGAFAWHLGPLKLATFK